MRSGIGNSPQDPFYVSQTTGTGTGAVAAPAGTAGDPIYVSGAGGGGGGPATIANGADVAQGNTADNAAAPTAPITTGAFTIVGLLKGILNVLLGFLSAGVDRSGYIGFTGAVISTTNASTTITVTTAPTAGTFQVGNVISAAGIPAGTTIASLGTGTGGTGTYVLSAAATATATGVATTSVGPTVLVPANTSRRQLVGQNIGTGNIAFSEVGITPAIGIPSSYTVLPNVGLSTSTNRAIPFVAATAGSPVTLTEI